jgi:hypothetical protein
MFEPVRNMTLFKIVSKNDRTSISHEKLMKLLEDYKITAWEIVNTSYNEEMQDYIKEQSDYKKHLIESKRFDLLDPAKADIIEDDDILESRDSTDEDKKLFELIEKLKTSGENPEYLARLLSLI